MTAPHNPPPTRANRRLVIDHPQALRAMRQALGLSGGSLSRLIGCSGQSVLNWETEVSGAKVGIRGEWAERLLRVLRLDPTRPPDVIGHWIPEKTYVRKAKRSANTSANS